MTLVPPGTTRRRPTEQEAIALELVSALLMFIGLVAFGYLFYAVTTNDDIRTATQGPTIPGIGVEVVKIEPTSDAEQPYFELRPVPNGPAAASGVLRGDRLTLIDDTEITPDMSIEQVRALIAEEVTPPGGDDFVINIGFARPQADGSLQPATRSVPKNVAPVFIIAFLQNFGIVIPLLLIVLGAVIFRLGTRLRRYDIVAARWSLVVLLWLMVGLVVVAIRNFWVDGKGGFITDQPFNVGNGLGSALPPLLAIIPLAIASRWLSGAVNDLFVGDETLTSRNTRFAWSLLVPTLAVLILVAGQPLEQTFITSLTDDEFSVSRPVQFVAFENYSNLLSVQLVLVNCQRDDEGACARTPNGSIIWERSSIETEEAQRLRELSSAERRGFVRFQEVSTTPLASGTGLRILGRDPTFLNALGNTIYFTVVAVTLELLLGLIIALVVNSNFRGRGLMRAAMLVPWSIPTVVSAVLWQTMMRPDQTGIFNRLLMDLGLISQPQQWFANTGPWMASIIAVDVWKTAPFMALLLLAGLQVIPGEVYEAASVDGAGKLRQFFSVTLPLLRPTIAVALIFRTLDSLRVFDVFQVLLDTRRPSMATYNYDRLVAGRLAGYASAVGVLIFILILVFTVMYVRIVRIEQE
ncbi:MAG: ABC transporter permease subunit [Anaerolineae bacterium]|nr:ABC transporter permease subunit [Anaerolineae bacterium]